MLFSSSENVPRDYLITVYKYFHKEESPGTEDL